MELWLGALDLGLAYGFLAMGVFMTMRVYNFPDITADGSLTLGASVAASALTLGINPVMALLMASLAGFAAGATTGAIHTKLKVNGLLSGILVTTALYSINLRVMGRSNIPLLNVMTLFKPFEKLLPTAPAWAISLVLFLILTGILLASLVWLFKTDFGLSMRATGDNETMAAAQGINTDTMKIIGIGISNALIASSGALVAQYQGFADISMGVGIVVFGLASVILGESLLAFNKNVSSIALKLVAVIVGAIVFRLLVAFALRVGLDPIDLKVITALFVLAAVALPQLQSLMKK